jgi:hypothetical protein
MVLFQAPSLLSVYQLALVKDKISASHYLLFDLLLYVLGTEAHKAGSVIHGREQTRLVTSYDVTRDLMLICKAVRQDFRTMVL